MDKKKTEAEEAQAPAAKPISLAPLKFEEAVEGLLKVKPSKKESEKAGGGDSIK